MDIYPEMMIPLWKVMFTTLSKKKLICDRYSTSKRIWSLMTDINEGRMFRLPVSSHHTFKYIHIFYTVQPQCRSRSL